MAGKSGYLEKQLLNQVLGGVVMATIPATTFFALFTAAPSDGGGGTEVAVGSYARSAYSNTTTNWPAASGTGPSQKQNANIINFNAATADQNGITAWGIYDTLTAGNLLYWGTFSTTQAVSNGQTASWAAAGITVTED